MRGQPLTEEEKAKIVQLRERGLTFPQIAQEISRCESTVGKFLRRHGYLLPPRCCLECGVRMEIDKRTQRRVYCSRTCQCRAYWRRKHPHAGRHRTGAERLIHRMVGLPPKVSGMLKQVAKKRGVSYSQVAREIILTHLKQMRDQKAPRPEKREAVGWENIRKAGRL